MIKDGSLTLDSCQIHNFTRDGLQVDGESRLTIRHSTISGCQESGLEIRKRASVVLDDCHFTGQLRDGIEVNIVPGVIDPGPDPQGWFGRPVPLVGVDSSISLSNNSH
ncbi:MAG: right-handed parallel beta-helix repeat-containing protein, partial [Nitrospira sp.]|nr:right-handed parallel beta-helix repeat-containing protein [Nitrospira sp.]